MIARAALVGLCFVAAAAACKNAGGDSATGAIDTQTCWRFDHAPGWALGQAGDVLCMERQRFVVLLADGTWDGWLVRWVPTPDARRAVAVGSPAIERLDIHWDVRDDPSGGVTLERPGGGRTHLSKLSPDAMTIAQTRLSNVADVLADCERARDCLDRAPATVRDLVDADTLYSARACAAVGQTVCGR